MKNKKNQGAAFAAVLLFLLSWFFDGFFPWFVAYLVFISFGVIFYVSNRIFKRTIDKLLCHYPTRGNSYKNFKRNYDIAFLGSTEAVFAVDLPSLSDKSGFNWGHEGQTIAEDILVAKSFFSILRTNGLFVVILSPMDLLSGQRQSGAFYELFIDRYLLQTSRYISRFDFRDWLFNEVFARKNKDRTYQMAFAISPMLYPLKGMRILRQIKKRREDLSKESSIVSDIGHLSIDGLKFGAGPSILTDSSIFEVKQAELEKGLADLMNFLTDRELRLAVVVPPLSRELKHVIPFEALEEKIFSPLSEFCCKNKIQFINYLESCQLDDCALYLDHYRLNKKGRVIFTENLLNRLQISEGEIGSCTPM